jgi:hypothetical protein
MSCRAASVLGIAVAAIFFASPSGAGDSQGRVFTGKDTANNIEVRLIGAKISESRALNLMAKFALLKGEPKEFIVSFPAHSHTTHETTLMNIVRSCTPGPGSGQNWHDWKEATLEAVFSVPKDRRDEFSHWYLISIRVRGEK